MLNGEDIHRYDVSIINKDNEKESTTKVIANKIVSKNGNECDNVQCKHSNKYICTGIDSEDDAEFKESYDRKDITDNTDEGFTGNNFV